jgi:hypothetical protein
MNLTKTEGNRIKRKNLIVREIFGMSIAAACDLDDKREPSLWV